mgnify:FL=1
MKKVSCSLGAILFIICLLLTNTLNAKESRNITEYVIEADVFFTSIHATQKNLDITFDENFILIYDKD